jgi:phospholipid/cholesterol/gamma-HCH transport system ATP-binding protein
MKDTEKYEQAEPEQGPERAEREQGPGRAEPQGPEQEESEQEGPAPVEKTREELDAEREIRQQEADEQAHALAEKKEEEERETAADAAKAPGAADAEKPEPVLTIKGLRKAFKDHEVLRGVDLHVNKGENLVILGKSGSGKSVLIKCLVGLEWPDEGEIDVFGKDLLSLTYNELNEVRLRTGFLFQNAALYDSMTVRENLLFPLRQHKKEMTKEKKDALVMEMLDNVGLTEAIDQMPSKLSGGQNKRIGLARTLILRPELMLYDEPTTGLDTGTAKEISELMVKTKQKYNISSITITHDMSCAKMTADRIIMLREGVVVAEGSYEELEKSEDEWVKTFF